MHINALKQHCLLPWNAKLAIIYSYIFDHRNIALHTGLFLEYITPSVPTYVYVVLTTQM